MLFIQCLNSRYIRCKNELSIPHGKRRIICWFVQYYVVFFYQFISVYHLFFRVFYCFLFPFFVSISIYRHFYFFNIPASLWPNTENPHQIQTIIYCLFPKKRTVIFTKEKPFFPTLRRKISACIFLILPILNLHQHIHPSLMPAAFKLSVQPCFGDHLCHLASHYSGAKARTLLLLCIRDSFAL